MSPVRAGDRVIALLCSDIHLSMKPPRARRKEYDWFGAMLRPIMQLKELQKEYNVPILCPGDVFNHWRAEPALINFALNHLPHMYAIPGQHDLPLHSIDLIHKSAFWTLVLAERIEPIMQKDVEIENDIVLHGFGWGKKIEPLHEDAAEGKYHVALVHDYIWTDGHSFKHAPLKHKAGKFKPLVKGYHAVAFGDNHIGFKTRLGGVPVYNCGGFMRRRIDEKRNIPRIGLLCKSGRILTHRLSIRGEKFIDTDMDMDGEMRSTPSDFTDFMNGLCELQEVGFDYIEAIEFIMKKSMIKNSVRKVLLEILGRG